MKHLFSIILIGLASAASAAPATTTEFIKTDQFGYTTSAQKIAVISDPQLGYNSALSYIPGSTMEVRNWIGDAVVFSGPVTSWNGGVTHVQSGDKVYWFDFSTVIAPGSYYIYDPSNSVGSYRFEINDCVYDNVLKTAMRMFFYQRAGFAKQYPYADTGFVDGASHLGPQQDADCRLYNNPVAGTSKDLRGGWFDAGDYNKYVNFSYSALCDLLLAYEEAPSACGDNYNIPESGNGVPDILDEARYELDWLLRMQNPDGSVLSVIGGGSASPPSSDVAYRRYGPATTSATFTAAAVFALAAIQFNAAGQPAYAATLQTASLNAWNWANANPSVTFYNAGVLAAGEQELDSYSLSTRKFAAAVYLYALTGTTSYRTYIDANYNNLHLLQWTFAYPFEGPEQDALLYYAHTPAATTAVKNAIISAYSNSLRINNSDNLPAYLTQTDAYRAFLADNNYTWNSNQTKSKQGNMFLSMNVYGLDVPNAANYRNAASGFVHYFHGVNPNSKVYLSNMSKLGAENSVRSFYHSWFTDGSALWDETGISTYGPAPGYMPGGVNPTYDWDACCPSGCGSAANNAMCVAESLDPPKNQPIQKSWKDFNTSWPINSWTITEAGIYTQAAYVRLLSKFCQGGCVSTGVSAHADESRSLLRNIYPQPASDQVTLQLNSAGDEVISVRLNDVTGKELAEYDQKADNDQRITIALPELSSGIYILEVKTAERVEVSKLIVSQQH